MKTLDEHYSLLETLLDEEHLFLNPGLSFATVCGWIGADADEMNRKLESELGFDGEGLLAELRKSMPERLERKYGIKADPDLFIKM